MNPMALMKIKGLIDKFSVSLNGENEEVYNELSKPNIENAYQKIFTYISYHTLHKK